MEPWFMAQGLKPAKTLRPIRTISDGVKQPIDVVSACLHMSAAQLSQGRDGK
jgi:hypothetical protein